MRSRELAFSLVTGSKLVLHLHENLPVNMDMMVGASGCTAIQILTSFYLKILYPMINTEIIRRKMFCSNRFLKFD